MLASLSLPPERETRRGLMWGWPATGRATALLCLMALPIGMLSAQTAAQEAPTPASTVERDASIESNPAAESMDASDGRNATAPDASRGQAAAEQSAGGEADALSIEALEARLEERRRQLEEAEAMQQATERQMREIEAELDEQARRERALETEVESLCRERERVEPGSYERCLGENRLADTP